MCAIGNRSADHSSVYLCGRRSDGNDSLPQFSFCRRAENQFLQLGDRAAAGIVAAMHAAVFCVLASVGLLLLFLRTVLLTLVDAVDMWIFTT